MPLLSTTLCPARPPLRPLLLGLLLLFGGQLVAQQLDLVRLKDRRRIEIPFRLENDFIIIDVVLNDRYPLNFLIDTGAENSILLDKQKADALDISYRRRFEVRGSDVDSLLVAHLATGVNLRLADRLLARNRTILVLERNYFDFSATTGVDIHGIIGGDFLMRFVVEFDYRRHILTLHEPAEYRPSRGHVRVPAEFVRHRPYLFLPTGVNDAEQTRRRKLLLDTGASLPLLLHTFADTSDADLPALLVPTSIASGLGGQLSGNVGRTKLVRLARRNLTDVVTYFQEVDSTMQFLNRREGIIGNRILSRFNVAVNYPARAVYFRPEGRRWRRDFRFNRTGINIVAGGRHLNHFYVSNVVAGSPGERAGLRPGDRIRRLNGTPSLLLSMASIMRRFEGKAGKRLTLRLERNGRLIDTGLVLEDLI